MNGKKEKKVGIKLTDKEEAEKYLNSRYGQHPTINSMVRLGVTVVEEKNGKTRERYVESDTLLGATRLMNSWSCGHGWSVIQFRVEEVGRLV
jgi:hypothetical protein